MPVTRKDDHGNDYASMMGLNHINTTSFLFGEDDEKTAAQKESATSPDVNSYLQMNATDDKFPILVRRDDFPGLVSSSSICNYSTLILTAAIGFVGCTGSCTFPISGSRGTIV